jgi:glycosyltransferase involved in cell wall biosynthesis
MIIVVDNGSTDNTGKIAASLGAKVVFEPTPSLPQAREKGRKVARGSLLVYLDADSIIPPSYLASLFDFFKVHPKVVAVSNPYLYFDGNWKTTALIKFFFKFFSPFIGRCLRFCMFPRYFSAAAFVLKENPWKKLADLTGE